MVAGGRSNSSCSSWSTFPADSPTLWPQQPQATISPGLWAKVLATNPTRPPSLLTQPGSDRKLSLGHPLHILFTSSTHQHDPGHSEVPVGREAASSDTGAQPNSFLFLFYDLSLLTPPFLPSKEIVRNPVLVLDFFKKNCLLWQLILKKIFMQIWGQNSLPLGKL